MSVVDVVSEQFALPRNLISNPSWCHVSAAPVLCSPTSRQQRVATSCSRSEVCAASSLSDVPFALSRSAVSTFWLRAGWWFSWSREIDDLGTLKSKCQYGERGLR